MLLSLILILIKIKLFYLCFFFIVVFFLCSYLNIKKCKIIIIYFIKIIIKEYSISFRRPEGTVTFEAPQKVSNETGDNAFDEDLRRLIKRGDFNGNDIPYDELHSIIIKDFFFIINI